MKVLFAAWGMAAHYYHMVPLVWALQAAGHEVRVAAQPPAGDLVRGTGALHVPIAVEHDFNAEFTALAKKLRENRFHHAVSVDTAAELSEQDRDLVYQMRLEPFVNTAVAMADDLVGAARRWRPDLIVADPMVLAAPLAAHAADVPLVGCLWGPALLQEMGVPGSGADPNRWPPELVDLYDRFGVAAKKSYLRATIDDCPEPMQITGIPHRMPMRYVPFNGAGAVPEWISEPPTRPRVCVTWGSTTTEKTGPEDFVIPQVLRGLAELDVEVVAAIGRAEADMVGDVGPSVRMVHGLPLNLLLPTCDLVLHHGGVGTMLTAAAQAVPQLMVVSMGHYRFNGALYARTGAGTTIGIEDASAERIRAEAGRLLTDPEAASAAERLRADILAQPTPAAVADALAGHVEDREW